MKKKTIIFNKKNIISCKEVPFYKIILEYVCWVLAGKPDGHSTKIS